MLLESVFPISLGKSIQSDSVEGGGAGKKWDMKQYGMKKCADISLFFFTNFFKHN